MSCYSNNTLTAASNSEKTHATAGLQPTPYEALYVRGPRAHPTPVENNCRPSPIQNPSASEEASNE